MKDFNEFKMLALKAQELQKEREIILFQNDLIIKELKSKLEQALKDKETIVNYYNKILGVI